MARRFRGEGLHKMDSKGRVSIPAAFRRVLEQCDPNWSDGKNPDLVIVYGGEDRQYLECFTIEAIDEVDDKISSYPRGSDERKILQNLYHRQALHTNVDETGRLVLPAAQRRKIGADKELLFVATGDTFQIWDPATYDAVEGVDHTDVLPKGVDPSVLLDKSLDEVRAERGEA